MKTMTCKQLYGPCDQKFQANSVEEMVKKSQAHGMAMAKKGDKDHIEIMEQMKKEEGDPEEYMAKTKTLFDSLPEDN